jgi:hypothetical protein
MLILVIIANVAKEMKETQTNVAKWGGPEPRKVN